VLGFPDVQHAAVTGHDCFPDQSAAGMNASFCFVTAIPMKDLDLFADGFHNCDRFCARYPGQQQLSDSKEKIFIRAGSPDHARQMCQHFDSLISIAEWNLLKLPGIKTDFFQQTILLIGIVG